MADRNAKIKQETLERAVERKDVPAWHNMSEGHQRELLTVVLKFIAENRQIPDKVLNSMPTPLLRVLLRVIRRLKAQGMMSRRFSVSDRVKWLRRELGQTNLSPSEPTEDEVLAAQPAEMRNDVLANEALMLRDMRAREAQDMSNEIAARNNPALGI